MHKCGTSATSRSADHAVFILLPLVETFMMPDDRLYQTHLPTPEGSSMSFVSAGVRRSFGGGELAANKLLLQSFDDWRFSESRTGRLT